MISWIGNIFIVLGLWFIGNKKRWAFLLSMIGEACWVAFSSRQRLWPLAFICCVFFLLAARNYIVWGRK